MTFALVTNSCAISGISETERTICRELRADLPTASTADTERTKQELAGFLDVYYAICGRG